MTPQDHEQQKRQQWLACAAALGIDPESKTHKAVFDRTYQLDQQAETITHEEIEEASREYVLNRQQVRHIAKGENASMRDFDKTLKAWDAYDMEQAFEDGANFALGKKFGISELSDIEKAAEKHADELRVSSEIPGALVPLLHDVAKSSYLQGAQYILAELSFRIADALIAQSNKSGLNQD